jgi:hypothetical protein
VNSGTGVICGVCDVEIRVKDSDQCPVCRAFTHRECIRRHVCKPKIPAAKRAPKPIAPQSAAAREPAVRPTRAFPPPPVRPTRAFETRNWDERPEAERTSGTAYAAFAAQLLEAPRGTALLFPIPPTGKRRLAASVGIRRRLRLANVECEYLIARDAIWFRVVG